MRKALYRKYRPLKLADVLGQPQVVDILRNSLKKNQISHAYLFTGPRGCGKTSVARIFAHEINGFPYSLEDSYIDIVEIDAASNTGVDNIRDLRERATIAPTEGKYKVYIIDEVHMLSKSAFNALLKILEEPPAHVVFIMATTDAYKVPITITSRSQVFTFQLATPDIMLSHLKSIAEQEKLNIDDDALSLIISRGGGSFRDTLSLLDQISTIKSGQIKKSDIIDLLGLPESDQLENLLISYESADLAGLTSSLASLINSGIKPTIIASDLMQKIIINPTPVRLSLLKHLPSVTGEFPEAKLLVALTTEIATAPLASTATQIPQPKPAPINPPQSQPTQPAPPSPESSPPPTQPAPATDQNFSPDSYLAAISSAAPSLAEILKKSHLSLSGTTLSVYNSRKVYLKILNSKNNLDLLTSYLPTGYNISFTDQPPTAPSLTFSAVQHIMGNIEPLNTPNQPF
ncbi:MAG: DNA polymerase III subunit gamma/tau [Candidatus Saccharibacteria bacterium]|nr:DNA polymerase III subunit gamma/tau [Candidatus Saccharibacteria bacterium]